MRNDTEKKKPMIYEETQFKEIDDTVKERLSVAVNACNIKNNFAEYLKQQDVKKQVQVIEETVEEEKREYEEKEAKKGKFRRFIDRIGNVIS